MPKNKLNSRDIKHLRECWLAAREDDSLPDGPEVEMTSLGYVELWSDGEVTAHGQLLGSFDDDGDWYDETGDWSGESDPAEDGEE